MRIEKSKFTGFCSGVKIAVDKAKFTLESEKKLYSYGEIIHNKDVINELNEKGLIIVDGIPETNDAKLLIRSHGVGKDVFDKINKYNLEIIDATCVKVKKIHKIVEEYSNNGYNIIIVGDKNHPEVLGILGWCNNKASIIESSEALNELTIDKSKKYCLVAQTTFNTKIFDDILNTIENNNLTNIVVHNTICDATKKKTGCMFRTGFKK